ncbi:hypothetical protein RBS60_10940 [Sinomonas sp. ASV486]|nr:hypothetical protein [Sinomonas sp. ASV486]MDQ4490713.1 hypothetical protein [Sinomonas sp. ASV486]
MPRDLDTLAYDRGLADGLALAARMARAEDMLDHLADDGGHA